LNECEKSVHSVCNIFCQSLKLIEMEIIVTLLIGAAAGWLGSMIYKGSGLGLIGNIVVGIVGSFVGYWLLGKLDINLGSGWVGAILTGAIGAIIILILLNLIIKKR
jgi:uncharacterized membrane protein YeaQ/YmgE (transglycosylase-associated protein family)